MPLKYHHVGIHVALSVNEVFECNELCNREDAAHPTNSFIHSGYSSSSTLFQVWVKQEDDANGLAECLDPPVPFLEIQQIFATGSICG